ncbi:hypothetical protein H9P43_006085 [Blastocladiella emersonii ATCC 22665]|nr:hypothetical protein H9P43_006085 [Blastocladiella emersonii ATCC 22665]
MNASTSKLATTPDFAVAQVVAACDLIGSSDDEDDGYHRREYEDGDSPVSSSPHPSAVAGEVIKIGRYLSSPTSSVAQRGRGSDVAWDAAVDTKSGSSAVSTTTTEIPRNVDATRNLDADSGFDQLSSNLAAFELTDPAPAATPPPAAARDTDQPAALRSLESDLLALRARVSKLELDNETKRLQLCHAHAERDAAERALVRERHPRPPPRVPRSGLIPADGYIAPPSVVAAAAMAELERDVADLRMAIAAAEDRVRVAEARAAAVAAEFAAFRTRCNDGDMCE